MVSYFIIAFSLIFHDFAYFSYAYILAGLELSFALFSYAYILAGLELSLSADIWFIDWRAISKLEIDQAWAGQENWLNFPLISVISDNEHH